MYEYSQKLSRVLKSSGSYKSGRRSRLFGFGVKPMARNIADSIYMRGDVWWARFTHKGFRYHFSLDTNQKDEALPKLYQAFALIEKGEYFKSTKDFEFAKELYLQGCKSERNKSIIRTHLDGFFGGKMLTEIHKTPSNEPGSISVVDYKLFRETQGAKASTLSKELRCLRDIIRCVDSTWENPTWQDTQDMILQNREEKIKVPLELEEVHKVCSLVIKTSKAFGLEYLKIGLIAAHTSMRLKDIVLLQEQNIDRRIWKISFYQNKVENLRKTMGIKSKPKLVTVDMADIVIEIFKAIPQKLSREALLFHVPSTKAVSTAFQRAFNLAGMPGFSFVDFRHFFGSYAVAGGGDLNTIKELMGHANIKTTEKYLHAYDRSKKQVINMFNGSGPKVDQICKG